MASTVPAIKRRERVIVAIDFGTSFSGFAYFKPSHDSKPIKKDNWECQPTPYVKTLSEILYDEEGKIVSWGFEARSDALVVPNTFLYRHFKMGIYEKTNPGGMVYDVTKTQQKKAFDVIVDYLKLLVRDLESEWDNAYGSGEWDFIIQWCLTIPAIWSDAEKATMIKAAKAVGMISDEKGDKGNFRFVLEPEAAAGYCIDMRERQSKSLQNNETLLILDAGGGTVDLVAHRLVNNQLVELTVGTGGHNGSSVIDAAFEKFLVSEFGEKTISDFKEKQPEAWLSLSADWQKAKIRVKDESKRIIINNIPSVFLDALDQFKNDTFDKSSRSIIVPKARLLFKTTLDNIEQLVEEQCKAMAEKTGSNFDYIFIVGGFGSSLLLQNRIISKFSKRINKSIVVPRYPGEATLDGAVLIGAELSIIAARIMRFTYGVRVAVPWNESRDKGKPKYYAAGGYYRFKGFRKFVSYQQEVRVDKVIRHTFSPMSPMQPEVSIRFYKSFSKNVEFVDTGECIKIGKIRIGLQSTIGKIFRMVEVSMRFGREVIDITACDVDTGREYEATIEYATSAFESESEYDSESE